VAFFALALSTVALVVNADCWSNLRQCQVSNAELQVNIDQCKEEKDSTSRAVYCWKCAYTETKRCMDASNRDSYYQCYGYAERARKRCDEDPAYKCTDPLYKGLYFQGPSSME
ncbi:hypothetical protein BGZ95_004876, partial [Linnemannia exigua]